MIKRETIMLKHAKEIFPDKWTKARSHDFIVKSTEKKLNKTEQEKLQRLAGRIRNGLFGRDFPNQDMMVTRRGRKLFIEPLFDE